MFAETPSEHHGKTQYRDKKLLCKIFGCDWRYNFPSIPNKCICHRCHRKAKLNLGTLEWEDILEFGGDLGTNEEMAERWFKHKN